jgi:tetratricopeptide (TPR) repeat protein
VIYPQKCWFFDTGSTDHTPTVARDWGAQVYSLPWADDFALARNASLQPARGDWILILDADESLTEAGRHCLKTLLEQEPIAGIPTTHLLLVTWLRQELGARQSPYTQVARLFRNRLGLQFNRPYHETIDESVEALMTQDSHWQIAHLSTVMLHHTGYTTDAIATRQKFKRAQTLMARHLAQHPQDAYLCNKLGALYGQQGDWNTGLHWINQGLSAPAQTLDDLTHYELHYHAGLAHRHLNHLDQAANHYQLAISSPIPRLLTLSALINLGSLRKQQGNLPEAIKLFEQVIQIDNTQAIAYYNLGVAYRTQGYLDRAIEAYQQAIQREPDYAEAYKNLGVALFKLGQLPDSKAAFQKAIQYYQLKDPGEAVRLEKTLMSLGL